jgi:RNA polymerase sigma-70 factor (ECF subfamily)
MTPALVLVGADLKRPGAFEDVRRAVLAQEPWACRSLYDSYAGRVLGYLRAQGASEPEDLTSEVFLRVFDRFPQFTGDEPNFRSWLFTIAHRVLIDDARRRQRRPQTTALDVDVESSTIGDVEHEALANVGAEWADELLSSLPPDQRAVVALRVTADLSLEQVAQLLDKRVGAVKALQHRALASLRRRCEDVPA